VSRSETLDYQSSPSYRGRRNKLPMLELRCLIAGIYADDQGRIYVHTRELLVHHGIPDKPEVREVVWAEILDMFSGLTIFEMSE
jgi:hypothetical protein